MRPVRSWAWFGAGGLDVFDGGSESGEKLGRLGSRELLDYVPRYGEYGPVVDFEYVGPGVEDVCLWAAGVGGAELGEWPDAVHPDEALVEDHGVGDDCACHAIGLDDLGHAEQFGDARNDLGPGLGELVEDRGCAVDAFFEGVGGFVDGTLGYGDEANEVGEVFDGAVEPAGFGEPCVVGVEYTVGEPGSLETASSMW